MLLTSLAGHFQFNCNVYFQSTKSLLNILSIWLTKNNNIFKLLLNDILEYLFELIWIRKI